MTFDSLLSRIAQLLVLLALAVPLWAHADAAPAPLLLDGSAHAVDAWPAVTVLNDPDGNP